MIKNAIGDKKEEVEKSKRRESRGRPKNDGKSAREENEDGRKKSAGSSNLRYINQRVKRPNAQQTDRRTSSQ
jgi:hypothetical protein